MLKVIPKDYFDPQNNTLKLLWEDEWRGLGITQSLGWEHYEVHEPEPHILLFKYVSGQKRRFVVVYGEGRQGARLADFERLRNCSVDWPSRLTARLPGCSFVRS